MDLLSANDAPGQYPASFYADGAPVAALRPSAKGAIRCDVCVVGGGFTGLSSALHLARRGYKVVLLEAQRVGFGASGRNGGQVGVGQRLDQDDLEAMLGPQDARGLWDISLDSVALVRELSADPLVDTPFHAGIIHADHRARDVAHSHAYVEKLQNDYGHSHITALDRGALRDLVDSPAYYGGSLDTASGHIDPLRLALGLARLAEAAGVRIFEQSLVNLVQQGDPCTIATEHAQVTADFAVFGCNGYLGDLLPQVASRVMPINNFIVATNPMTAQQQEALIAQNYAIADSKFVVNYFRFSEDHRLLFGGTESYGYRFPKDIAKAVRKPLSEIFPQLSGVGISHAWGGTLGITMNRMPHFHRIAGNMLSMSGYSGHGVAMATLAGQIGAEAIDGQARRFDLLAKVPSPGFPGGAALRSPLLVLAMLWYSLRDKL